MFMQAQITGLETWIELETSDGTLWIPEDLGLDPADVTSAEVYEQTTIEGYGARLSAPGYLDATSWGVHPTRCEAIADLCEAYDLERCPECLELVAVDYGEAGTVSGECGHTWPEAPRVCSACSATIEHDAQAYGKDGETFCAHCWA